MMFKPLAKLAHWATHPYKKRVYAFNEGTMDDKHLLGNKGANLCEMSRFDLARKYLLYIK